MQYRERVIFVGQHIDEEFSNQILATMLYLDSIDDSKKLYMYINGPGGDVSSSFMTWPGHYAVIYVCNVLWIYNDVYFLVPPFKFKILW